jgi:hypothetical protein
MDKRPVRIRIGHDRLEAMHSIFSDMATEQAAADEHGRLLYTHLCELQQKMDAMLQRRQERYTLSMCGSEALALYQLWHKMDTKNDRYARVITGSIIDKIESYYNAHAFTG